MPAARHGGDPDATGPSTTGWAYRTRAFRAFSHTFAVRSTCAATGRWIEDLLAGMPAADTHDQLYSVVGGGGQGYLLYEGDELVRRSSTVSPLLNRILMGVNQRALTADPDMVVVHAAGAALGDVGLVMPGHRRAGKSTLVACLVEAGFDYLSDEAVGVPLGPGSLVPFAKPVSIDPGTSQEALGRLRPQDPEGVPLSSREVWQLAPHRIRADAQVRPVPAGLVIAPRYEAGGRTWLEPIGAAAMLALLLEQAFGFQERPLDTMGALARLVDSCDCRILHIGDANVAVGLLEGAVRERGGRERQDVGTPPPAISAQRPPRMGAATAGLAISSTVAPVTVGEEIVAYDARHRTLHLLDRHAAMVWQHLDGLRTAAQIADALAEGVSLPVAAVASDVEACLAQFSALGLLEGHAADPAAIERARMDGR